ncbi:diuretic hormone receptor [Trichonephila inaurata madagascariensis]|uniref:Diuretic hormone receptor n=1 Tax=Trichonephila inaurata madagascariensis TaxID=2747483 RepID=A0A8X6WS13_9ARAC|nr:diuretic hormone receptor [Trichonephila inaurata madagascariensis]
MRPGSNTPFYCNATWDGLSCWPTTSGGSVAYVPCFAEFNGVHYDTSRNASRLCLENGTWLPWSNYRSCQPLKLHEHEFLQVLWDMKEAATIYYVGYGISLVALSLALLVFLRFKDLRCLRNTIHTNLMVTYLLIDVTWILTATLQSNPNPFTAKLACFLVILLTYLMGTNFFWMLVEGLYLYMQVVKTFAIEDIHLRTYAGIGWVTTQIEIIVDFQLENYSNLVRWPVLAVMVASRLHVRALILMSHTGVDTHQI